MLYMTHHIRHAELSRVRGGGLGPAKWASGSVGTVDHKPSSWGSPSLAVIPFFSFVWTGRTLTAVIQVGGTLSLSLGYALT